jgi:hypothetical protein
MIKISESVAVEEVPSSLLKKLFSTILKLTPLQIRNSRSAQTVEFAAVLFVKNGARKNLQFALGVPFIVFFNNPDVQGFSTDLFISMNRMIMLTHGTHEFSIKKCPVGRENISRTGKEACG